MKKLFIVVLFSLFCSVLCFAETQKYRYVMITDNSLMIADFAAQLPEEILSDTFISVNTQRERMEMEYGLRSIKSYFYSGEVTFIYADYTKDFENPDMSFIDTWDDVLAYVRGTK